jgi:putative ABC transport system substrate-binding protein
METKLDPASSGPAGRRAVLRRGGALALGGAAAAMLAACGEDDRPKTKVVGWLNTEPPEASTENFAALLGRMAELGYVTGDNLTWDYAPMRLEQLSPTAQNPQARGVAFGEHYLRRVREMQEGGADAILALENEVPPFGVATISAATSIGVPVVCLFSNAPDYFPGVVDSHAKPGRNITGITPVVPEENLWPKRLELLKIAFPAARRVGFFTDPANRALPSVQSAAGALGLDLLVQEIPGVIGQSVDLTPVFARASAQELQAVVAGGTGAVAADVRVYDFADQQRLPVLGIVRDRSTLYYAVNRPALYRRLAEMLDLVLRGADPRDIPVELPAKFDFVIDLARARAAGLTVSPAALALATEVVS